MQSPHQVDMKNVVECPREFLAYFNALETYSVRSYTYFYLSIIYTMYQNKLVFLLSYYVLIIKANKRGWTPLHFAAN